MNLPEEFLNKMKNMLNDEFNEFIKSYEKETTPSLRLNILKNTQYLENYVSIPVSWAKDAFYYKNTIPFGKMIEHNMGLYYIQEASAMFPVEVLDPQENETVLDLCAAPGGKSTQIATRMHNSGLLISNEIIPKRANILKDNISRLGITNAIVLNETPEKISKTFNDYFDKILVDAPCSGEGMFRKHPEVVSEWSQENVKMCENRQLEILNTIKNCLKENGILVYSTCTFSPEENEQTIERFLQENQDFILLDIDNHPFTKGITNNTKTKFKDIEKTVRILPHKVDGEGHFIAKLQKKSSSNNGYNDIKLQKTMINKNYLNLYQKFEKEHLTKQLKGTFLQFGDNIYNLPQNTPNLNKLKVIYSGLLLGSINNNRFEPSHEFALSLTPADVKNIINLTDKEVEKYTHGETIQTNSNHSGWTLLTYNNNPLSWGKISGNTIKNHYPKYLRK